MAVELLLLNFDGPGGRQRGATVCAKEGPDDKPIPWNRKECPPLFRKLRLEKVMFKDLDPGWLDFGYRTSRFLVDDAKLTSDEKLSLDSAAVVTSKRLSEVKTDNSEEWERRVKFEEQRAVLEAPKIDLKK